MSKFEHHFEIKGLEDLHDTETSDPMYDWHLQPHPLETLELPN